MSLPKSTKNSANLAIVVIPTFIGSLSSYFKIDGSVSPTTVSNNAHDAIALLNKQL